MYKLCETKMIPVAAFHELVNPAQTLLLEGGVADC
jgi:hypothetical protein